jgi:osmotically-inducible protein OsmY
MRKAIVIVLATAGLLACSKEKQPAATAGTTTIRGAEQALPTASVEEVRTVLIEKRPDSADTINGLIITNEGGVITLRGKVEDEPMRSELINRVRAMPNVRGVRDELHTGRKTVTGHPEHGGKAGTTTTTGAPIGEGHKKEPIGEGHEKETEGMSKPDAVRKAMEKADPKAESVIRTLTIKEEGEGIILLKGTVPDEITHQALIKAAKETHGVKSVKDELKVNPAKK